MITSKTRISIYVSKGTHDILHLLAKRQKSSVASKAAALLEEALELEEDRALVTIVEQRMKNQGDIRWLSHEEVWGTNRSNAKILSR